MGSNPRGRAVVISNTFFFDPELDEREGSKLDLKNLGRLFTGLGFTFIPHRDKTAEVSLNILYESYIDNIRPNVVIFR